MKQTTIHFQTTPEFKEKIQEIAKSKHLKVSDIARIAMYQYVEQESNR